MVLEYSTSADAKLTDAISIAVLRADCGRANERAIRPCAAHCWGGSPSVCWRSRRPACVAPLASGTPQDDADAAITAAWQAAGGDAGPLGPKDGGVYPAGDGFGQNFAGGKIFFTPDTGAHVMTGAILDKYMSMGGPADGDMGFPTIDEGPGKAPGSRNTTFSAPDNPVIFWTPDTGARVVRGAINAAWDKLGGSAAQLGVPSDDESYHGERGDAEVRWRRAVLRHEGQDLHHGSS